MIATLKKSRRVPVFVRVITGLSKRATGAGSVCAAGRTTRSGIEPTRRRQSPRELVENPLYLDNDYKGLHRWEVA